ncbi:MAG TPA: hypothetical protein VIE40_07800 [Dehalococcoidia bacterium]|jgi:hypothetical protein
MSYPSVTAEQPTFDDLLPLIEAADSEDRYWQAHDAEFRQMYDQQFVAVLGGRVVGADPHLLKLSERLASEGIDIRETWLNFIGRDYARLML